MSSRSSPTASTSPGEPRILGTVYGAIPRLLFTFPLPWYHRVGAGARHRLEQHLGGTACSRFSAADRVLPSTAIVWRSEGAPSLQLLVSGIWHSRGANVQFWQSMGRCTAACVPERCMCQRVCRLARARASDVRALYSYSFVSLVGAATTTAAPRRQSLRR